MMRSIKERRYEYLHRKAFTRWLNSLLGERDQVVDLFCESQNGKLVRKLCEIVNFQNAKLEWECSKTESPTKIHYTIDTEKGINMLKNCLGIELVNIHASDILNGNKTSILGLMWTTILGFQSARLKNILETKVNSENQRIIHDVAKMITSKKHDGCLRKKYKILLKLLNMAQPNSFDLNEDEDDNDEIDENANSANFKQSLQNMAKAFEISHNSLGLPYLLDIEDMNEMDEIDEKLIFILLSEILVKLHHQQLSTNQCIHEALKLLTTIQGKLARLTIEDSHSCCKVFVDTCRDLKNRIHCDLSVSSESTDKNFLKRIMDFIEVLLEKLNRNFDNFMAKRNPNDDRVKCLLRTISEDGVLDCICSKVNHYETMLNSFEKSIMIHMHCGVTELESKLENLRKLISSCEIHEIEKVSHIHSILTNDVKSCCNHRLEKLSLNFKKSMQALWTYQENLELNISLTTLIKNSHDFFENLETNNSLSMPGNLQRVAAELDGAQKLSLVTTCKSLVALLDSRNLDG